MKKIIMIITTLVLTFTLTACKSNPLDPVLDGFTYINTDTISFTINDGVSSKEVYTYTFTNSHHMFINKDVIENAVHYDFTNNNNYKAISSDFKAFLDTFEIIITDESVVNYGDEVELSVSIDGSKNVLEKVALTDDSVDVYAYIVLDNGVRLRITYTIFTSNDEVYYIPSYIIIEAIALHQTISYEFLGEDNDYFDDVAVIKHYQTSMVALPPKTGVLTEFETLLEEDEHQLGYYQRVTTTNRNNQGIWDACEKTTNDCLEKEYLSLEAQVFGMTIDDVYAFYIEHFSGTYFYEDFVFVSDHTTYRIIDLEEVQTRLQNGEVVDVVNMKVEIFE